MWKVIFAILEAFGNPLAKGLFPYIPIICKTVMKITLICAIWALFSFSATLFTVNKEIEKITYHADDVQEIHLSSFHW